MADQLIQPNAILPTFYGKFVVTSEQLKIGGTTTYFLLPQRSGYYPQLVFFRGYREPGALYTGAISFTLKLGYNGNFTQIGSTASLGSAFTAVTTRSELLLVNPWQLSAVSMLVLQPSVNELIGSLAVDLNSSLAGSGTGGLVMEFFYYWIPMSFGYS